jgi:hypothetical protein
MSSQMENTPALNSGNLVFRSRLEHGHATDFHGVPQSL